jgi:hypothetical protein
MTAPISIAAAGERILAQPAPILFLDTCALLDVLRVASERDSAPHRIVPAVQTVVAKVTAPSRGLWLLGAARLDVEWNDNVTKILSSIETHIARVDSSLTRLHAAVRAVSSSDAVIRGVDFNFVAAVGAPRVAPFELPIRLREICESVLEILVRLSPDADVLEAADRRIMAGMKPAAIGKREAPDCLIIETCFALCKSLRARGFAERCAFVSSNKSDFYAEGRPLRPHEDLAGECAAIGLFFALAFDHALSVLYPSR